MIIKDKERHAGKINLVKANSTGLKTVNKLSKTGNEDPQKIIVRKRKK